MQPTAKPTFIQYRTNIGCFVTVSSAYSSTHPLQNYVVNGIDSSTADVINGYAKIPSEIVTVKLKNAPKTVISHYKLKYPELASRGLPLEVDSKKASYDDDGDLCLEGVNEPDLYEAEYKLIEGSIVDVAFDVKNMGDYVIENPTNLKTRKIKLSRESELSRESGYSHYDKAIETELAAAVSFDEILKLITPEFALCQVPCKLTSHQMYRIVRQHLIENLNMKENSITSNYDFCFTVKKRVHTKPYIVTVTDLLHTGRRVKTKTTTKNEKLVEVFEMTYSGYKGGGGYDGYTCIPGMQGDSLDDLYRKLTTYLDDLVSTLNASVTECECCGGTGHIIEKAKV